MIDNQLPNGSLLSRLRLIRILRVTIVTKDSAFFARMIKRRILSATINGSNIIY